ncbi:MAG: N-6 DNA methylase, partial [Elusimicrobiota bacterium]|jgi:type I restriction enzyme M protein|nr:N-6 DNA methylase [Elusimicrobiota bacterium]
VILTNPPFGANITDDIVITKEDIQEQKKIIEKNKDKNYFLQDNILTENDLNYKVNARFKIGSKLTEVLFIERCLNLLKKGGRMGIVLPEGVLNASNLQKCRDFVEGKAKIIMITSISQDTFKSAGASVKTSLLFFKKFTVKEEKKYSKIKKQATNEVNKKYENEIKKCENLKAKEKKQKLKKIEIQKETEIKKIIKEKFNYQIPIAKIENVGITTTGKETKNDLIELLKEFKEYTKNSKLWETKYKAKSISED